jgi:ABC-type transport system involved in cytochrome c biogenesis permease subunit
MSAQTRCHCQSCTIRGMMGPAILIALGVLFLLHQMRGGRFDFGNTWPVLLMVIGVLLLASALAPRDGHIEPVRPATVPPPPPPAVPPTAPPPQSPYSGQGQ